MNKALLITFGIIMAMCLAVTASACSVCNETCSPCGGGCTTTDLSNMFVGVTSFDTAVGNISGWNTSCITSMNRLFANSDFNQNINSWDVSQVTDMTMMFIDDMIFNQPLSNWDTKNVIGMDYLFGGANSFNQDISGWNTSSVTSMYSTFQFAGFNGAYPLNENFALWDISQVTDMTSMFYGENLSTTAYDNLLNSWSSQPVKSGVVFGAGDSQYTLAGKVGRDILTDTYNWTITDGGLFCIPGWVCTAYSTNCIGGHQACNAVTGNISCGFSYGGDYSEFTPQVCTAVYTPNYSVGDFVLMFIDLIGKGLYVIITFVAVFVVIAIVNWGAKKVRGGK